MEIINAFLDPIMNILPNIPTAILNLIVGFVLIEISVFVAKKLLKLTHYSRELKKLLVIMLKTFLWFLLIIFILRALGLGSLVVAITGSAVVLAFVLNSTFAPLIGDIISGVNLANDKDFKVGMKVSFNEGKTIGVIKKIDIRKVRLIDDQGKTHVVPNSLIEKGEWIILEEVEKTEKAKRLSIKKLIRK